MLFDFVEDIVFGKILLFANISVFLGLNRAQKWTKTVKFGYFSFEERLKIWKASSNTVFV